MTSQKLELPKVTCASNAGLRNSVILLKQAQFGQMLHAPESANRNKTVQDGHENIVGVTNQVPFGLVVKGVVSMFAGVRHDSQR